MSPKKAGSRYRLDMTEKTTCPNGHHRVALLAIPMCFTRPAFYICFKCGFIGQVGVGPVPDFYHETETKGG